MTPDTIQPVAKQRCRITVTKDGMAAMLVLYPPDQGQPDPTAADLLQDLALAGVTYGISQEALEKAITEKAYNAPVRAAEGTPPIKGENSIFTFHFDTSGHHAPQQGSDGRIDYKDMRYIQNAEIGRVLATKTPATAGVPGTNVYGKEVAAAGGREFPLKPGQNTKLSDDGLQIVASANGAIVFTNGEVSIKDVLTINGDVDISVGNLESLGSVHVRGHIKAGFTVKVDGHLEVDGNVEDAVIQAKGNILVRGGFFGNGTGELHADGDITVKFAEGQKLIAGGNIFVGGELINCHVIAKERVIVKGKKSKIIGGDIRAGKEIRASELGSEKGTQTHLHVAFDASLMQQHQNIIREIQRVKADAERVKEALQALIRLQMSGNLPPEKKDAIDKLRQFQRDLPANVDSLLAQKKGVEERLREFNDAQIIAEERVYAGVKAYFGIVYREIMEEFRVCKMTLDGTQVVLSDFKNH